MSCTASSRPAGLRVPLSPTAEAVIVLISGKCRLGLGTGDLPGPNRNALQCHLSGGHMNVTRLDMDAG